MAKVPRIPLPMEMKVVALMARGDTQPQIIEQIEKEFGRKLNPATLVQVRKRNPEVLASIRDAIVKREKDDAVSLLKKSNKLIGDKLRAAEAGDEAVKLTELTAVSKEMFHQMRVEGGDEESATISSNPKEKLAQLKQLLDENDEIRLTEVIFAKRHEAPAEPPLPVPSSVSGRDKSGDSVPGKDIPPRDNPDREEIQVPPPSQEAG